MKPPAARQEEILLSPAAQEQCAQPRRLREAVAGSGTLMMAARSSCVAAPSQKLRPDTVGELWFPFKVAQQPI